VTNREEFATNV